MYSSIQILNYGSSLFHSHTLLVSLDVVYQPGEDDQNILFGKLNHFLI